MNGRIFFERYSKILILQLAFAVLVIALATALRYFDNELFCELREIYDEYMNTEISLSLVLDDIP